MIGIYKITNLVNERVYIGQSLNISDRIKTHKSDLHKNKHSNEHLQNAYNKYGEENFKFEIIEECEEDKLTEREQYWIDYYGGLNSSNNYNQRDAGSHGAHSIIARNKISKAFKGKPKKPGRKVSEAGKLSLSLSHIGIKPTEETKRKMSEAHKNNPYHHTEKTKKLLSTKISKYYKEHPELRAKVSNRMKNRIVSKETRAKIGNLRKGTTYKNNKELCKKHSDGLKKAYKDGKLMHKQKLITIYGITKNQSEWINFLDISGCGIINKKYSQSKTIGDNYLKEKFVLKLLSLGVLDNFINDLVEQKCKMANLMIDEKMTPQNKALLVDFLLS